MPIPDFQTIMLPFMQVLENGDTKYVREVTAELVSHFQLTDEERHALLPSGQQSLFSNRVGWAKSHLKNAGLIVNPARGRVAISELGREVLRTKPTEINCKLLKQYPSYLKFIGATQDEDQGSDEQSVSEIGIESTKTPLELIEASLETLRKSTEEELLSKLKACSSAFFERVVVDLLNAMGYGGVSGDGSVTGKSGDGGIDGVIKEDKLGLDIVCIQAKRYSDATVGRPIVQQFVGSMDFVQANKGVIITTSQFSKDAYDFIHKIVGKKVVLIDGEKVAALMLEYNIGVVRAKVYELKELSNDFFDEDDG
jgi:restriction system protein